MTFGIAGDAERADAAAAEQAGIDGVGSASEWAVFGAVAGDDQNTAHLGLAVQSRETIIERVGASEIAHRDVRHRFEPGRAQPDRRADGFFRRPVRHGADIDTVPRGSTDNAAMSASDGRVASMEKFCMKPAMRATAGLRFAAGRGEGGHASVPAGEGGEGACGMHACPRYHHFPYRRSLATSPAAGGSSRAPARDHIGFVVEPKPAASRKTSRVASM